MSTPGNLCNNAVVVDLLSWFDSRRELWIQSSVVLVACWFTFKFGQKLKLLGVFFCQFSSSTLPSPIQIPCRFKHGQLAGSSLCQ